MKFSFASHYADKNPKEGKKYFLISPNPMAYGDYLVTLIPITRDVDDLHDGVIEIKDSTATLIQVDGVGNDTANEMMEAFNQMLKEN